jgi:hypothetical protein
MNMYPESLPKTLEPLENVNSCHHILRNRRSESICFVSRCDLREPFHSELCDDFYNLTVLLRIRTTAMWTNKHY